MTEDQAEEQRRRGKLEILNEIIKNNAHDPFGYVEISELLILRYQIACEFVR